MIFKIQRFKCFREKANQFRS